MPEWKEEIRKRLAGLNLAPAREAEIVEEVAQHLADRYEDLLINGTTTQEAERTVLTELGESELLTHELRRVERRAPQEPVIPGTNRRTNILADLWQDLRYAARRLAKQPGFVFTAVVTLALGIGANTAIFSLVNAVLLRSLPVEKPEEIVSVSVRGKDGSMKAFSRPNYVDFRDQNQALSGLLIYRFVPLSMSRSGNNERIWGYEVSGNYFDVLGVKAIKGRTFALEEDRARLANPVIVVSYDSWQRRFGGDPDLVGKELLLNNHPFKIIGVAPQGFKGTELIYSPELWVPASMMEWVEPGFTWPDSRDDNNFFGIGRLKPGVTPRQAEASLNMLARQLGEQYPKEDEGLSIEIVPTGFILPELRGAVVSFTWILMGSVSLVLLVSCTNLAGLLLARATDRRREIAIRLAMGANRFRLIRQLLTESILLSATGGVAGFFLAIWTIRSLLAFKPPIDFPLAMDVGIDWRVLLFSLGISFITGVVFGLAPALQATRPSLLRSLKDNAARGGASRNRLRSGLVVVQIALSLVVLIAAGLVVRTLQHLQTMNPGFNTNNALMMSFDLGLQGYDKAHGQQFYRDLTSRIHSTPGVQSAAITNWVPLSLAYHSRTVYVEGQPPQRGADVPVALNAGVTPRYFETMGTPILQGREFTDQDLQDSEQVAVVNETFVRRMLPFVKSSVDAINRRFSFRGSDGPFIRIVGVTADGKYWNIAEEPRPFVWRPMSQDYNSTSTLVVRTTGVPGPIFAVVRREIQSLDPNLPVYDVKTFTEHMRLSLFPAQIAATVLGVFGLVALILSAIGIYGITSYAAAQRTREIGIRMALGAQQGDVLKLVLNDGVKLTIIGVAIGLFGTYVVTRAITSVLYGVSATDPLTFGGVSFLLVFVALLACYVPARKATKVDPLVALRYE